MEPVTFIASFEGENCIQFGDARNGKVRLTVPASEFADAILLSRFLGSKSFRVTIEPLEESHD